MNSENKTWLEQKKKVKLSYHGNEQRAALERTVASETKLTIERYEALRRSERMGERDAKENIEGATFHELRQRLDVELLLRGTQALHDSNLHLRHFCQVWPHL